MILLTRLNGAPFAVNADLIERVEQTPDTVVTMVDGRKHVVTESPNQVIDRIVEFRATILVAADRLHSPSPSPEPPSPDPSHRDQSSRLRLVPGQER
jgi:flagellar protein FlbD